MTFDFTVNVATIVMLVGGYGAGVAAWVTALNRIAANTKTIGEMKLAMAALEAAYKMLKDRVEDVRAKGAHELSEFKLEVAKSYATNTAIKEVEDRVVAAIERLGDRLDKLIDGPMKGRAPPR